jgi:hypothetical protein
VTAPAGASTERCSAVTPQRVHRPAPAASQRSAPAPAPAVSSNLLLRRRHATATHARGQGLGGCARCGNAAPWRAGSAAHQATPPGNAPQQREREECAAGKSCDSSSTTESWRNAASSANNSRPERTLHNGEVEDAVLGEGSNRLRGHILNIGSWRWAPGWDDNSKGYRGISARGSSFPGVQ